MNTSRNIPVAKYFAKNQYMQIAIEEARIGIHANHGGPFGAVIVKDNQIIGQGHNHVLINHDPTQHGEVDAIRNACKNIESHDLSGSVLYTTGEPCPMCLCACMWANIEKVYYGCTIGDNSKIGFRDQRFDELMGGREKLNDYLVQVDRDACISLFEEYNEIDQKTTY